METPKGSPGRALAVVTGASSGIGAAYARKLAERAYDLLVVARRKDRLAQCAAAWGPQFGVAVEPFAADLLREEDLRRLEERLASTDRLEFLVNNAGFGTRALFHQADPASQDAMHRLHVLATVRLCRAALPQMVARNHGAIVNVSSVAGFMQGPYNISYCATKAWANSFTEGLALEMRVLRSNVRIQALCPGFTKTEFHQAMGLDRSFAPRSWWMTAEEVVDASLAGLARNKLFVVPGLRYKLIVTFLKYCPRWILHPFTARAPNVRRGKLPSQEA